MSPEHFVQKRTPWCDVFSMGVVLYELLACGTVPYASDRDELPVAYGKLMSNEPAIPISRHVPELPPGLEEVVAKVINKQKLSGYETAEEFLFELSRIQDVVRAQFVNERLTEVDSAVRNQESTQAFELVNRILRVDPKNATANRKKFELKKLLEEARRNQHVRAICVQAEGAIQERQFDAAQRSLEEARQLDPGSPTVAQLQQKLADIRNLQEKINTLVRTAQEHGRSGRWEEASSAIREASDLDRSNTNVLKFRAEIERRVAQEHGLIEQARGLLHDQHFREASGVIRELEAMAPRSERVVALKELAVREHREYIRRTEIAAYQSDTQSLIGEGNLAGARARVDEGIAKYPDERSLLDLRASIEQQQEEIARRQFVDEKLRAGEQAVKAKNFVDAIAILEQAIRRVPDPALESLLAQAKEKAGKQAAEKLREQYLKSAKESLAREDAASAVVTLEMAQSEFGAADTQIHSLLEEARYTAERQARQAAERAKLEADRQAREAAEREEINATLIKARSAAHDGNFDSGLKFIEQAASKLGMRPELSAATNEIKAARTAEVVAGIDAIVQHANSEVEGQHFSLALEAIERGKAFTEFATQAAVAKLKAAERHVRKAQQDYEDQLRRAAEEEEAKRRQAEAEQTSATRVLSGGDPAMDAMTIRQAVDLDRTIRQDVDLDRTIRQDDDRTIVLPATAGGAAAAAKTARVPSAQRPASQSAAAAAAPAPAKRPAVVEEAPASSSKKWIGIGTAAAVVILAVVGYLIFGSSSAVQVRFETDPAGAQVSIDGQTCQSPCGLKIKPGRYTVKAAHDGYSALDQDLDITAKTGTVPLKLASIGPAVTAPIVGTLMIDANVEGADIFVDNQLKDTAKGKTDKLTVAAGSHQIRLEKQGYQGATKPIDIAKDAQASLSFTLEKGVSTAPVQAYVIVTSVPNAKVFIDKQQVGTVQADRTFSGAVESGKRHTLEVSLDGYQTMSKTFTAKDGERLRENMLLTGLKPTILSFAADSTEIQAGKSAILKWETQGATDVSIDGLGNISGATGSRSVSPTATTTYSLIASGPGGKSAAQKVTIKVAAAAVAAIAKPVIVNFELGSETVQAGEKVKLIWSTQNADSVTIDPEVGTVKASGSTTVSPSKTTTYTLTAKGAGGEVKSSPQTLTIEAKASVPTPTPVTPTPTATGPDDAQLIKSLIEQRYKGAWESNNPGAAKAIWPSLSKDIQSTIKAAKGIRMELSCTPKVSGDSATASCSQSVSIAGNSKTVNVVFSLSKSSGSWLIESSR
jgi:plastocyanin